MFDRGHPPAPDGRDHSASSDHFETAREKITVLVAEDDRITRLLAETLLRRAGYQVLVAENGREALSIVEATPVDIVLMDLVMPVMDGFEAAARIRNLPSPKCDLPLIAVTAHALDEVGPQAEAAGMNILLSKPYQEAPLVRVIEQQLSRKEGHRDSATALPMDAGHDGRMLDRHQLVTLEGAFDPEEVKELISAYQFHADARLNLLNMCLLDGNGACVSRQANAIAGMAGNIGARQASDAAHILELASQRGEHEKLSHLMAGLSASLKKSFAALNAWHSLGRIAHKQAQDAVEELDATGT
ncbi:MAG: response regulator [Parvibaculum sp.]|nr:response regulator [Parvibaculum sp.]